MSEPWHHVGEEGEPPFENGWGNAGDQAKEREALIETTGDWAYDAESGVWRNVLRPGRPRELQFRSRRVATRRPRGV